MASTGASLPATGVAADPLSANSTLPAWAVPAGKGTFQPMATGQGTEPPGWLPQAKLPQAAPPVPPASVDAAVAPVAPISPLAEPTAAPPEEDVAESLPAENEKNEKDEERDGTTSTLEKGPVPDEPAAAKPAPKKRVRKSASGTAGKRPRRSSTSSPIDYAARPAHKAPPPIPANVAGKTPKPSKKTAKKTKQDSVNFQRQPPTATTCHACK